MLVPYSEADLVQLNTEWYYEYGIDGSGRTVPVLIPAAELDWGTLQDKYYYIENTKLDGEVCNKWQKIEPYIDGSSMTWTTSASQYIYTNDIVNVRVESDGRLNKFGLAEKTLNTAGKWSVSDIELRVSSAELAKLKPEYLRSGAEIFGLSGSYGSSAELKLPAGIYEFRTTEGIDTNFGFYHNGAWTSDGHCSNPTSGPLREKLIYVTETQILGAGDLSLYDKIAPYVSCIYEDGREATPEALAEYIMNGDARICLNCWHICGDESWDTCPNCMYINSRYCSHGDVSYTYDNYQHTITCNDCNKTWLESHNYNPNTGYCACGSYRCQHNGDIHEYYEFISGSEGSHYYWKQCPCGYRLTEPREEYCTYEGGTYCIYCHHSIGRDCNQANYVWYEDAWSDNSGEFEQASYQYKCNGCSCNFRAGSQYDTLASCPCCGGTVSYSANPDEPGSGDGDYMVCPWCGQYAYDGSVCTSCDYGKDEPGEGYSCPQCGSSVDWTEYPYTGQCTEGHYVNLHDPEYCSHSKIEWHCNDSDCRSSGTCCEWSGDTDYSEWVSRGICPSCQLSTVYTN